MSELYSENSGISDPMIAANNISDKHNELVTAIALGWPNQAVESVYGDQTIFVLDASQKYDKLISGVRLNWPGQTKHEIALEYIRNAESVSGNTTKQPAFKDVEAVAEAQAICGFESVNPVKTWSYLSEEDKNYWRKVANGVLRGKPINKLGC